MSMNNTDRKQDAYEVRVEAAKLAATRVHPRHVANGDEQKFHREIPDPCKPKGKTKIVKSYLASFTKGMAHCYDTGLLLDPHEFQDFVKAIDSGNPRDFIDTQLGPAGYEEDEHGCKGKPWKSAKAKDAKVRGWESQGAGNTFDLEGPDAQAVTMPPAPALGSDELIAEIAEVYAQALLRDVPFTKISPGESDSGSSKRKTKKTPQNKPNPQVDKLLRILNGLDWFRDPPNCCRLTDAERGRLRGPLTTQNAFRGITPGDDVGPYLSQFLLIGNRGINGMETGGNDNKTEFQPENGYIAYGAITIDQRVRVAVKGQDYMTSWDEWFDVQNGANLAGLEAYDTRLKRRFITTPRDLATYVHFDALYEAYLNACLILLGEGIPFDPGIPFQISDIRDHQQGFAQFGGPHILTLVTEVATRALKAVRYQKFGVHRRLRPEALAARLSREKALGVPELERMRNDPALKKLLDLIARSNGSDSHLGKDNFLLPMAFCEGSPMHPSYGAGHGTVAGACVTILKAFFDHKYPLTVAGDDCHAFVPTEKDSGRTLTKVPVCNGKLTVEGELNKLASNISIGRDWAGVHYFSDYIESIRLGEQIAIGILEEQKLTYGENFSMTVPLFDGGEIRI